MQIAIVFLACFAGGFCPLINADAVLLGAALLQPGSGAPVLIIIAVLAQVGGKLVLFGLLRGGAPRILQLFGIERLRSRAPSRGTLACAALVRRLPPAGAAAVMLSAATGLPPFFAITFVAAASRITAARFCAAAAAGRTLRTALIVLAPRILTGV